MNAIMSVTDEVLTILDDEGIGYYKDEYEEDGKMFKCLIHIVKTEPITVIEIASLVKEPMVCEVTITLLELRRGMKTKRSVYKKIGANLVKRIRKNLV